MKLFRLLVVGVLPFMFSPIMILADDVATKTTEDRSSPSRICKSATLPHRRDSKCSGTPPMPMPTGRSSKRPMTRATWKKPDHRRLGGSLFRESSPTGFIGLL